MELLSSVGRSGFEAEKALLVGVVEFMWQYLWRCCKLRIKHDLWLSSYTKNVRHKLIIA